MAMICSSLCRVPFMAVLLSWVWENSHSRRSSFRGLRHLRRIGCKKAASITQKAIKALGVSDLTVQAIDTVMATDDEQGLKKFAQCDDAYYKNAEPIAGAALCLH